MSGVEAPMAAPPGLPVPAEASDWHATLAFFDGVDYAESTAFRVITSEVVPPSMRAAAADARAKVLLALATADRGSVPERRLWKCATFMDRLLFCVRPGGRKVRRGGVKHASHKGHGWVRALAHRVHLLHCGDWAGLFREAQPFEPPERARSTGAAAARLARRAELLVANREVSKAVAAIRRDVEPPPPTAEEYRGLLALFPGLPEPPADGDAPTAMDDGSFPLDLREALEAAIVHAIVTAPKLSGPGPADSRFEHWDLLRENPAGLQAAGTVLARLLLGEVPAEAAEAHLAGRLVGIPKSAGGVRPLACGSVARRLAAKGACAAFGEELMQASGTCQYAVGREGGAEKLHKTLTLLAELRPDALFVKLDFQNAYNSLLRSAVLDGVEARVPNLRRLAETLCPAETHHWWYDGEGRGRQVLAVRGVDQGCPLSPALFAIGIAPALEELRTELRKVDERSHVLSYLDDIYIVITPEHVTKALTQVRKSFTPLGLELHAGKQRVWSPQPVEVPAGVELAPCFTCLGAASLWVPEECARVDFAGPSTQLEATFVSLVDFSRRLFLVREHGLSLATALTLHRAWAGGTLTHHLRSNLVEAGFTERWDEAVTAVWERELDRSLGPAERAQLRLPTRLGGCGVASAAIARLPAFLGSWELCLSEVASTLGANSAAQFRDFASSTRVTIEAAAEELRRTGVRDYTFDWEEVFHAARRRRQHDLSRQLQIVAHGALLAALPPADQADLRSAGGTGAGGFLEPQLTDKRMADAHLRTALRRRLRLPRPGFDVSLNTSASATHCQHRYAASGITCGHSLVDGTHDPMRCDIGGAGLHFHHRLRDFMADWIGLHTGSPTLTEQVVAAWNKVEPPSPAYPEGRIKLARLDVSAFVAGLRTHVDVGYRTAATDNVEERVHRAGEDGRAASCYVAEKRRTYPPQDNPGEALVPFIIEALGRPSMEAATFLRAVAPAAPSKRAGVLAAAWQSISIITQTRLAEMLISAELPRPQQ
jgi:hypothetical protein